MHTKGCSRCSPLCPSGTPPVGPHPSTCLFCTVYRWAYHLHTQPGLCTGTHASAIAYAPRSSTFAASCGVSHGPNKQQTPACHAVNVVLSVWYDMSSSQVCSQARLAVGGTCCEQLSLIAWNLQPPCTANQPSAPCSMLAACLSALPACLPC